MLEQVSNFDQYIKFITGFAGSGKSTKLVELVSKTPNYLVLVPTHKAADVLFSKGIERVYTIYSVLKLVPTLNENYNPTKNQKIQRLKQIGNIDLLDVTDVYIDEFSMISQDILDMLLNVLPASANVTVLGDPFQLPPVSGELIDPLIYTDDIEELTTQHRADAPEVVETFMRFMEYIKTADSSISLVLNSAIKKGTLEGFNPDTDRALAFTNKRVQELNAEIAEILNLPEQYSIGEALVANGIDCKLHSNELGGTQIFPSCISKGKLMTKDKLQLASIATLRDIEKYNTDLSNYGRLAISIDDEIYTIYYDINHYQTLKKLKGDVDYAQAYIYKTHDIPDDMSLKEWCSANRHAKGVKERGKAWSKYIAHQNLVFSLQRPFATTVHKSQGSEFSTVYIDQEDMKLAIKPRYYMQYARLMYVALSRAINKVIKV